MEYAYFFFLYRRGVNYTHLWENNCDDELVIHFAGNGDYRV